MDEKNQAIQNSIHHTSYTWNDVPLILGKKNLK